MAKAFKFVELFLHNDHTLQNPGCFSFRVSFKMSTGVLRRIEEISFVFITYLSLPLALSTVCYLAFFANIYVSAQHLFEPFGPQNQSRHKQQVECAEGQTQKVSHLDQQVSISKFEKNTLLGFKYNA